MKRDQSAYILICFHSTSCHRLSCLVSSNNTQQQQHQHNSHRFSNVNNDMSIDVGWPVVSHTQKKCTAIRRTLIKPYPLQPNSSKVIIITSKQIIVCLSICDMAFRFQAVGGTENSRFVGRSLNAVFFFSVDNEIDTTRSLQPALTVSVMNTLTFFSPRCLKVNKNPNWQFFSLVTLELIRQRSRARRMANWNFFSLRWVNWRGARIDILTRAKAISPSKQVRFHPRLVSTIDSTRQTTKTVNFCC